MDGVVRSEAMLLREFAGSARELLGELDPVDGRPERVDTVACDPVLTWCQALEASRASDCGTRLGIEER